MKMRRTDDGFQWPVTGTTEERAVDFSPQSASLAYVQYTRCRSALKAACRNPDAPIEGVKVVRGWLNTASKSRPQTSPFRCWVTPDEWYWIAKALRGWDTYAKPTTDYNRFNAARRRGWHNHTKEKSNDES